MTREQVASVCSANGVTLDDSWDGASQDVPVLVPLSSRGYIGHMGSYRGTAQLSKILEWHLRNVGEFSDGTLPASEGGYI